MIPEEVLEAVRPPRMRPALWHALRALLPVWRGYPIRHGSVPWWNFVRAKERWEGEWAKVPELAALGQGLLARHNEEKVRCYGCRWLTMFPSLETVSALEALALDAMEPRELREHAIATLGNRRLEQANDALFWAPEVVAAADAALLRIWETRSDGDEPFRELPIALRHVADVELVDRIAEDLSVAVPALEAFASESLARRLLSHLPSVSHEHAPRIIRLVGHTLGAEAREPLLAYAKDAPYGASVEALMTALAVDASRARPAVDAFLDTLKFDRVLRERAALQEAHPGVVFAVRGLAVARVTATIPRAERAGRCRDAASWLAALGRIEAFPEAYLYGMWRNLAFRSEDDAAIVGAAESTPDALEHGPFLVAPYLDALARAGRFKLLASVALQNKAGAHATWALATMGRPFAALAVRRGADGGDPEAIAGEAIALFMGGRPDLAMAVLEKTPPRPEPLVGTYAKVAFPGPDERWRVEHEAERWPALVALSAGLPALLASVRSAPAGADPDAFDFTLFGESERRLADPRAGWSIDLPATMDASSTARFRRTLCPTCGAPKSRPSLTPYVYCDYCGSLADYDLEMAGSNGLEQPGPKYQRLLAELEPELARALARGDEPGYRETQRALFETWVDACPTSIPPRAREAEYRKAYVAYRAECATTIAFDETSRLYAVAVEEAARAVVLVPAGPGAWRATPASFDALCRAFFPRQEHVDRVLEARGVTARHPDRASSAVKRRVDLSTFVQEWLPKLDGPRAEALLDRAGMADEYVEASVPEGDDASCAHCGSEVKLFAGARCAVCEACGHRLDVAGDRVECAGCGAPLAPGEGATSFSCPHCKTAMQRVPSVAAPES